MSVTASGSWSAGRSACRTASRSRLWRWRSPSAEERGQSSCESHRFEAFSPNAPSPYEARPISSALRPTRRSKSIQKGIHMMLGVSRRSHPNPTLTSRRSQYLRTLGRGLYCGNVGPPLVLNSSVRDNFGLVPNTFESHLINARGAQRRSLGLPATIHPSRRQATKWQPNLAFVQTHSVDHGRCCAASRHRLDDSASTGRGTL